MMADDRCTCVGLRCRLTASDERHGTENGYGNLRCRCEPCRAAHARYLYEIKQLRITRGAPEHIHGTPNGYGNWGCRCADCTTAWTDDCVDRYHRRNQGQTDVSKGLMPAPKWRFEDRPHAKRGAA